MRSSMASFRAACGGDSLARSVAQAPRGPLSASSRFSNTPRFSNTVGFWNLRPMPSVAIAASSSLVRSTWPAKNALPLSGRVLPMATSIIVVLPAPFGPMMLRSSPLATTSDRSLSALNPSKLTVTPSR